jgi:hypothetical protein
VTSSNRNSRPIQGGRYVLGCYETFSNLHEYVGAWGRATGKASPDQAPVVLTVPFRQYEDMWGIMGTEVAVMFGFWENSKDSHWLASGGGDVLITSHELLHDSAPEMEADLVGTEAAWRNMDWSHV